jgi:hypothetical protein
MRQTHPWWLMARRAWRPAVVAAGLAVSPVLAQSEDDAPEQGAEPEGVMKSKPSGEASMGGGSGANHRVERGDTLWDLSQKFLGSPWYWPKVWSYNPEIANPHWIYPGNSVRFYPSGDEVPTQVELGEAPKVDDVDESAFDDDLVVGGKIGYVPKNALTIHATGFATPREIEEAGHIMGSFAESVMLSFPQTIYVTFNNKRTPKLGDEFIIFRPSQSLRNPVTDEPAGYFTKLIGSAKVIAVSPKGVATCQLVKEFDAIERNDLIGPMGEPLILTVRPRANEREIKNALIISNVVSTVIHSGEHSVVVVDKGSDDGVKQGNIFTITRQNDYLAPDRLFRPTQADDEYPIEVVGSCMALEVKTKASTCLVVSSLREIVKGDKVEMRSTGKRQASR